MHALGASLVFGQKSVGVVVYTFPFSLVHLSLIGSAGEFDLSRFTPLREEWIDIDDNDNNDITTVTR